ncbi:MAG: flippase-like domain-containing protein [Clostridia bacterium]|nr:flippase-like domain-containing protein [Clostridia bacterium]
MANFKTNSDKYKKIFWAICSPMLAVLTVWLLLKQNQDVSMRDIAHTAAGADKLWLSLAAVSSVLFIFFEAFAIKSILKGAGFSPKFKNSLIYGTADIYFSAITPSATGGQPASAYFMIKDGIPGGVCTAVLMLNLMMYTLSIVALGITSIVISPSTFTEFNVPSKLLIWAGTAAQIALAVFFMTVLKKGDFIFDILERMIAFLGRKKILKNIPKKTGKLHKAKRDYSSCSMMFSGNYPLLLKAFLWNLLQRFSQIVVPSLLFISMGGNPLDSVRLFSKQCLITIGYNFVPLPGAMGVADYLMLNGFSELMEHDMAFHLEMLSRGMTFYICVSFSGLIAFAGYLVRRRNKRHEKN